jgi:hypothetical protein
MADLPALRTAFVRLGFSVDAARQITDGQNIDTLEEVKLLQDTDVSDLCKALKRPGGTIPDPNQVAGAVGAAVQMIPNCGVNVPAVAETYLKLTAYFLCHRGRISHPVMAAEITIPTVRRMWAIRDHKEAHKTPTEAPKFNEKYVVKAFNALDAYLCESLGETKIPLAYVTRDSPDVQPSNANPPGNYETTELELMARAPHVDAAGNPDPTFAANNMKVWTNIQDLSRDNNASWTWVKSFARARNGRAAYMALHSHYTLVPPSPTTYKLKPKIN